MSVLVTMLFLVAAGAAIYSLVVSVRDYGPQVLFLLNGDYSNSNSMQNAGAVWPTRLRIREEDITGVPQVLFRRRKPFVRKASLRPANSVHSPVTRRLRYALAPDREFVLA